MKEESASKPGLPSQPKAVSVAVMGFKNLTGKPEAALVSDVLAGQISMELVARGDVRTVSDELITNTKAQLPLADANSYGKETLSELGRLLEADYIVTGSYESNGEPGKGEITLNLVIQNAFTGETLAVLPEKGTQANVRELATRGGGWVHDKLPISAITSSNSAAAKGSSTLNPDAERFYRDGLNKLASNNLLAARDSLQKAVAAAPDFAMGQAALSKAWFELGYDQNAREAAEKAYELSKKMASFEDRLILEGNYRERNGEWDRAIEIYGELCNGFPEDVNYALELARIQTDSGKAKAALETLANLRNRVASSEQDPRIDLQEAIAAEALANAELQQKSAASAAQKANRLGARFLEAEAFWQQCSAFQNLGKPEEAEQTCQKANQLSDMAAGQKLRARSLSALANLRDSQSQFDEAHELREEALLIAQKTGSQKDIVGALLNLANSESRVGRMADAKAHREKAISVAEAIGDKSQLLKVLNDEATYLSSQGEYQEAMDMYGRAFSLATEIGDQDGIGMSLVNRGALHIQIGEISAAEEDLKKAKAISTRAGLMDILGPALNGLGDVKVAQADFDAAENEYQEGRKVFEQLHDSANLANNILSLASLCLEKGDISRAESLARSAVEQFQTLALGDAEAAARETLARALLAQTRIPDARAELDRADGLHPQDHGIAISVMSTQALLLAANHQPKEALDLFSKAGESAHQFHLLGQELEIALWKLRERGKQGEPASAIEIQAIRGKAEKNGLKLVASRADELHAELTRKK